MPPFIEAYNMNGDTVSIKSSKMMFSNYFTISSNGKRIKLDLNIFERVFIIKGDSIYYPISWNGITTDGEPRSSTVSGYFAIPGINHEVRLFSCFEKLYQDWCSRILRFSPEPHTICGKQVYQWAISENI